MDSVTFSNLRHAIHYTNNLRPNVAARRRERAGGGVRGRRAGAAERRESRGGGRGSLLHVPLINKNLQPKRVRLS